MISAHIHGIEDEGQARRALEEIERLIADAEATGVQLDHWIAELAEELRASIPAMDALRYSITVRTLKGSGVTSLPDFREGIEG